MHPKRTITQEPISPKLPPTTTRWIRLLLGFGVSVAVGLAPYLGKLRVPLFTPLLSIIPVSLQDIALPISAAAMGIVAVLVQWYGWHLPAPKSIARSFKRVLTFNVASLAALVAIEFLMVVHVPVPSTNSRASFAVGISDPQKPLCAGLSRSKCIADRLTLDETSVESYFGETQANVTKLVLTLVYVSFMASFGGLVGFLILASTENRESNMDGSMQKNMQA